MIVIPKLLRARINRLAHDQALRHEQQLRDKWTAQLLAAMETQVSYADLQNTVTQFEKATEAATGSGM